MKGKTLIVETEQNIKDDYEAVVIDTILDNNSTRYLVKLISAYDAGSERRISHGTKTGMIRVVRPDQIVMMLD